MHARLASGVLLALGLADMAVLNLFLVPRLGRGAGRDVVVTAAPYVQATEPATQVVVSRVPVEPANSARPVPVADCPPVKATSKAAAPDIVFGFGDAAVAGVFALADVRRIATELRADLTKRLLVRGHSDRLGAAGANLAVSKQRAVAVARLLEAFGAPHESLVVEAVGDTEPADSDDSPPGWARNRRVQLLWR